MSDTYPILYDRRPPLRRVYAPRRNTPPHWQKVVDTLRAMKPGGYFEAPLGDFPDFERTSKLAPALAGRAKSAPGEHATETFSTFVRVWRVE